MATARADVIFEETFLEVPNTAFAMGGPLVLVIVRVPMRIVKALAPIRFANALCCVKGPPRIAIFNAVFSLVCRALFL